MKAAGAPASSFDPLISLEKNETADASTTEISIQPNEPGDESTQETKRPCVERKPQISTLKRCDLEATIAGRNASNPVHQKKKRKMAMAEPEWNDMFFRLSLFRAKHKHVNVAKNDDEALFLWCCNQRRGNAALNRIKDGESGSNTTSRRTVNSGPNALTPERKLVLESIGFIWTITQPDLEDRWEKRFQELVVYKAQHGHANVPQNCPLGKWVKAQREQRNESERAKAGIRPPRVKPKPCIPPHREAKLTALGLSWYMGHKVLGWDQRYELLREFHAQHGHTNVPQSNPELGRWACKQRSQYSLRRRGKKNQLTDDRVEKLEALGFAWVAPHMQRQRVQQLNRIDQTATGIEHRADSTDHDEFPASHPPDGQAQHCHLVHL